LEKSLQATAASGSSGRRDAIEDAGTDRGQRDARRLYPRSTSTSRDRTLGSSSSNERKYHKVVVENHLEMEVNGKAGQMWELVFFNLASFPRSCFFLSRQPWTRYYTSVVDCFISRQWQRTADSFAPCPSAISTTTSFSSSKLPGDHGKNSDDSHALNPRKIYSSLN